jgi:hypothetical protein
MFFFGFLHLQGGIAGDGRVTGALTARGVVAADTAAGRGAIFWIGRNGGAAISSWGRNTDRARLGLAAVAGGDAASKQRQQAAHDE